MENQDHYEELKAARLELRELSKKLRAVLERVVTVSKALGKQRGYNPKTVVKTGDPPIKAFVSAMTVRMGIALDHTNVAISSASRAMGELSPDSDVLGLSSFDFGDQASVEAVPDLMFKQALLALQGSLSPETYRTIESCPACDKSITLCRYTALDFEWTGGFQHAITEHDMKAPAPFYKAVMDNFLKEFKSK